MIHGTEEEEKYLSVYLGLLYYEYHLFPGISIKDADSIAIWFKVSQDLMDSFY